MLCDIFELERINMKLTGATKMDVFTELVETAAASNPDLDRQKMLESVILRENKMHTLILPGIAIPHGYSNTVSGIIGAIGYSQIGIEYDDNNLVHLLFLLVMDEKSREQHLRVLAKLLELLKSAAFAKFRKDRSSRQEWYDLICRF